MKENGLQIHTLSGQMTDKAIRTICYQRNDKWAREVLSRLEFVTDLHACDAVCHQTCNVNWFQSWKMFLMTKVKPIL